MRKEDAREIIDRFALVPRGVSKRVLREICSGSLGECEALSAEHRERLSAILDEYRVRAAGLGTGVRPKNLPFYLLLKDLYPELNLQHMGGDQLSLEAYYRGLTPSILSLLLGIVPREHLAPSARESRMRASGVDADSLARCNAVFRREGVVRMSEVHQRWLCEWLGRGRAGKPLTIVSPVCPDYAAEKGGDGPFRFTFEGLNGGIGLAARRLFESLPALHDLFAGLLGNACSLTHRVYVGDFEGFSEQNVRRVGLDKRGFLEKLLSSRDAISAAAPRQVLSGLFCDLCGGAEGWLREYAEMQRRVEAGEFGARLDRTIIREIALARRPLYQRWFPSGGATEQFFENLVVQQGIEYAVMGKIISEHFENPLVLGADHHKMGYFYTLAADFPVVYLSRNYE